MYRGGFSGVECCIGCLGTVKNDEVCFYYKMGHCVQYGHTCHHFCADLFLSLRCTYVPCLTVPSPVLALVQCSAPRKQAIQCRLHSESTLSQSQ